MQHDPHEQRAQNAHSTEQTRQTDASATHTAAQKEEAERTNPQRTGQVPKQSAEVPLGTGNQAEPPGGGGRQSQRVSQDKGRRD
jgi:hypothetical protein